MEQSVTPLYDMLERMRNSGILLLGLMTFLSVPAVEAAGSRVDFLKNANKGENAAVEAVSEWPRDKVFLKIGDEVVLWGPVYDYIKQILKTKPLVLPAGTTWSDVEKAKRFNERKLAVGVAKRYMGGALMAQLARNAGVDASKSKLTATGIVEKIVMAFPEESRQEVRAVGLTPGSYISSCVTNTLLSDAYVESLIKPGVKVTEAEIASAIALRNEQIEKAKAANIDKKEKMNALLVDLRKGIVKFERAAEVLSQCVSSERKGYWGRFGESSSSLLPEIKSVVFSLPTNVLSDVVETPYSYHILKVTAEPPPELAELEEEEDLDEFEEGEKVICLSHIMLEKSKIPPQLDEVSAREFVFADKVAERVSDLKSAAMTNLEIQCAFPLKLKKGTKNDQKTSD